MNKVILIGNLTKDVETSTTTNGVTVAKFTIGVGRRFKNVDGEYDTDFINIVAWRDLASRCAQYLNKGSKVAVCGSIQTRSYEGQDGTKRYVTEVIADEVQFLNSKASAELTPIEDYTTLPF